MTAELTTPVSARTPSESSRSTAACPLLAFSPSSAEIRVVGWPPRRWLLRPRKSWKPLVISSPIALLAPVPGTMSPILIGLPEPAAESSASEPQPAASPLVPSAASS